MGIPTTDDLGVSIDSYVATVEIRKPPHNFFDLQLLRQIADTFEALDENEDCRVIVLCAKGKTFCAGIEFGDGSKMDKDGNVKDGLNSSLIGKIYNEAVRLFSTKTPIVAAVHGAAIGGGLGLAMVADFRVTCPDARFSANFTRLGFHPGFGLTATLPEVVGRNNAALMFYTSRRLNGEEAHAMGLAQMLVPKEKVRETALSLAGEIATNSPLGVVSTRATLRMGLAERVRVATKRELEEQDRLRKTADFREGVAAMSKRRTPDFKGE
jgi:enoyl-CoA hydratase/carnithine racemase